MFSEIIKVNYDNVRPTVTGREMHKALGISIDYTDWFLSICNAGFSEDTDYIELKEKDYDNHPRINHLMTFEMAKEICLLQQDDTGKQLRQWLQKTEDNWNPLGSVLVSALQNANRLLASACTKNKTLAQEIDEMKPKAMYYDAILQSESTITTTVIAKEFGWSARELNKKLEDLKVQYKQGRIWLLCEKYQDQGYTRLVTIPYESKGILKTACSTKWTQKGREFIHTLLKQYGILPTGINTLVNESN